MRIREQQKELVRDALLKSGTDLIEKNGLAATTVESITSSAGVAKGTFYNYFRTKHDLIYAAMMERSSGWERELDRIMSEHPTTLERLIEVFIHIIAAVEESPELHWIWLMEGLRRVESTQRERTPFTQILTRVFSAGQSAGEIRQDRDPYEMAHDLSGLLLVHVARARHVGNAQILYETLPRTLEVYVQGAVTPR